MLYLILFTIFNSILFSEEAYFEATSESFIIDTIEPIIEVFTPVDGQQFYYGQTTDILWEAYDDSEFDNDAVSISIQPELGVDLISLFSGIPNTGIVQITFPDVTAEFAQVVVSVTDAYGYTSSNYSPGYFTVGNIDSNYDVDEYNADFESISEIFTIDTKAPIVELLNPNDAAEYAPLQEITVNWIATDDNINNNSIDIILITELSSDGYLLDLNIENNGERNVILPDIQTNYGQIAVRASDLFGYNSVDLSDNYITIGGNNDGEDDDYEYEDYSAFIEQISSPFTIDTKAPEFNLLDENFYFYPSGGELFTDYSNVPINWNCNDDSFEQGQVEVSLAYLLGGWYTPLGTYNAQNPHSASADFTVEGLVENSIWGRLLFTARDDYGNIKSQYNNDYFTLGSSDGSISIDLYDQDDLDMFIGWTWDSRKHRVLFGPRALESLTIGDQILIVDENGVADDDCSTDFGFTVLGAHIIEENNNNWFNIAPPIVTRKGIDHCNNNGGAMPGYVVGDTVRIKIITSDNSYYLRPSDYRGSIIFNNNTTIIKEFDLNPYYIDNDRVDSFVINDDRDWDEFNVYGKVTNHQGSTRGCDDDGICDTSEELTNYTNEIDCLANSGQWNGTLCYYDYNNDGTYSPNEVTENIADCYNDCCPSQGVGENEDWCFVETVNSEEYTHSLVQNNYLSTQSTSATINYRVWVVNEDGNEVYKTVETEAYELQLGEDEIPDYINNLNSGWNWISLNVLNSNMDLNNLLNLTSANQGDYIKGQTTSSTFYDTGDGQWYPVWNMDIESLYLLNITNNDASILYQGTLASIPDVSIDVEAGWNWIGYIPNQSMEINAALSNINPSNMDYLKGQTGSSTYYSSGNIWYPSITLSPGSGYMLKSETSYSLIYSEVEEGRKYVSVDKLKNNKEFDYYNYEFNSSSIIELDMPHLNVSLDDKIVIYKNDEIRGIAYAEICPLNNKILFPLMIYSNEIKENDFYFKYYNSKLNRFYEIREKINFQKNDIRGNAEEPLILTDINMPFKYELSDPYPNPFNPVANINLALMDEHNNFSLKIYDIRGRLVKEIYNGYINYGYHSFRWDGSSFASGVYLVHMVAGDNLFTKKITLLK